MLVKRNMDDLMELELPVGGIAACHACACNPRKFPHYPKDWVPENCGFSAVSGPAGAQPVPSDSPRPHNLLNSGTVVLEPSIELAQQMYHFLATDERVPSFSFPDQDLLAAFFHGKWRSINWYYNALRTLRTVHAAIWDDDLVRCVHYILADKPWQVRDSKEFAVVNGWWWEQYEDMSRQLDSEALALVSSIVAPA
ncbi:unnamed protein product [Mycena citricolor]|uniref:Uncharacterized protein n=1 Tax=Mycena citricolor TaxID=2018698 RepID=A0AAD2GZF9_9AGAR|nr:unnamed protein product [Mycena citricolor]